MRILRAFCLGLFLLTAAGSLPGCGDKEATVPENPDPQPDAAPESTEAPPAPAPPP